MGSRTIVASLASDSDVVVALANIADQAANTVVANATGSSAAPTAVAVGANTVLGRAGANIVAAQVATGQVANDAIDNTKLANMAATTLKGNATGGAADPADLTLNSTLEFSGSTVRRAALTGDVTAPAGSNTTTLAAGSAANLNSGTLLAARMPALTGDVTTTVGTVATTIANNAVTNAKAADMAANTVKANATAGSADPADLSVGTNTVVGRVAGNIVAAQLATGQCADDAITDAKLRNSGACSVIGRSANSGGDPADISAGSNNQVLQRVSNALTWTASPDNLNLAGTGNDLGGLTGAKGRTFVLRFTCEDLSSGISLAVGTIDGHHSGVAKMMMPVACKCVSFTLLNRHTTGSDPGDWTAVLLNDTASTNATRTCTMADGSDNDNETSTSLSSDLAFARGDRCWMYFDSAGAGTVDNLKFTAMFLMVTT